MATKSALSSRTVRAAAAMLCVLGATGAELGALSTSAFADSGTTTPADPGASADPASSGAPDPSGDPIPPGPIQDQCVDPDTGLTYDCTILYASGGVAASRPALSESSIHGIATLTVDLAGFAGKRVIFFARSASGHGVRPLGTATLGANGIATRVLHLHRGLRVAIYGKVLGVGPSALPNLYSKTVAFVVK